VGSECQTVSHQRSEPCPSRIDPVGLHAVGVHPKAVRMLETRERIEMNGNGVFIVRKGVTSEQVCANRVGRTVVAEECDIEKCALASYVNDRPIGRARCGGRVAPIDQERTSPRSVTAFAF
jgi:hypothetical protein